MTQKIGLQALFEDADFRQGIANYTKQVQDASKTTDKAAGDINKSSKKAGEGWQEAADKVAKSAAVMGAALTAAVAKVTLTAARTEELGIVLNRVGENIGKTEDEMAAYETSVKEMGITTQASRQALIQMIQAQIDLSHATDLARLAQDAAVIAQMDSSEAFETLITVIQRGSPVMARTLGLAVDFQGAYEAAAEAIGITAAELSKEQKIEIRTQEVLRNSAQIAGTYTAAMTTAGKQMRSMNRHVEELANEFGDSLLPAFSSVIAGGTDFLKWMRALPAPVKATMAELGAGAGILLSFGGAAAIAAPKIVSLISAMSALGGVSLLGPVGAVAGLAALAIHLRNVEIAHRQEAAAILESSGSYNEYVSALEAAGLSSYVLSEGLYDIAKGAGDAASAIDALALTEAQREIEAMARSANQFQRENAGLIYGLRALKEGTDDVTPRVGALIDEIERQIPGMNAAEIAVLRDAEALRELATELGLTAEETTAFVEAINQAADITVYKDYGVRVLEAQRATKEMSAASEGAGKAHDTQTEAVEELTEAYEKALGMFEDFVGALASGVTDIRDIDAEAAKSAQEYEAELADLEAQAKNVYANIKTSFEASLPDATTVQERMSMTEDAWDEWALRLQDIMVNGVQSPWLEVLNQLGYQKPDDVGLAEWAEGLREQVLAGEILVNENAAVWQEHSAKVAEAQAAQSQAVAREVEQRKAKIAEETEALRAAREAQLAEEQAARDRAMLELALDLAEASGLLATWAESTLGPSFATVGDSASEVLALIDAGMVDLQGSLGLLVGDLVAGIDSWMAATQTGAEQVGMTLDEQLGAAQEAAVRAQEEMAKALELQDILDPDSAEKAAEETGEALTDGLEAGLAENPLATMEDHFQTSMDNIIKMSGLGADAINEIPTEHSTEVSMTDVQPFIEKLRELKQALDALKDVHVDVSASMETDADTATQSPHIAYEYALHNLKDFVDQNFPMNLEMNMDMRPVRDSVIPMDVEDMRDEIKGAEELIESLRSFASAIESVVNALDMILRTPVITASSVARFRDAIKTIMDELRQAVMSGAGVNKQAMEMFNLAFENVKLVVDSTEGLSQQARISDQALKDFRDNMVRVIELLVDISNELGKHIPPRRAMENIAFIVLAMADMAQALSDMAEMGGVSQTAIDSFAAGVRDAVAMMIAVAGEFEEEGAVAAAQFSATVGIIGQTAGEAAQGFNEIAKFGGVSAQSMEAFRRDMPIVVDMMTQTAVEFDTDGVQAAQLFSESVGAISESVGDAVNGLIGLAGYRGISSDVITRFGVDMFDLVSELSAASSLMTGEEVTRLLSVSEMVSALGKSVEDALDALIAISGYRGGIGEGMDAFISDLQTLIMMFDELGEAIPAWLVPGSPTPLEMGLRGINRAFEQSPIMPMMMPTAQNNPANVSVTVGPNHINNGMDQAAFENRVLGTVSAAIRNG